MDTQKLLEDLNAALVKEDTNILEARARDAVREAPNQAFGYYYLAEANWQKAKYRNAEICIAKAIELDPFNADYMLRLASYKEGQNDLDSARLLYNKALKIDDQNILALLGLARYYTNEAEDAEQGITYISKAIEIDGAQAILYILRAKAYLDIEEYEEVLADTQQALSIESSEDAFILRINALMAMDEDDVDELKATYQSLIAFCPQNAHYAITFGNYLIDEEDNAEAEQLFKGLLSKTEGVYNGPLHGLLGLALVGQEKYKEAIAVFDEMAAADPEDEEVYIQRSIAKLGAGDTKGAIEDLRTGAKYVSDANKIRLYQKEAELHMSLGDWAASQKLYETLIKDELYQSDGYYGLGQSLHKSGDLDPAFEALQKAQKLKNKEAKAYLQEHFSEQLAQQQQSLVEQYQAEFAKNAACKALSPYFGAYCKFSSKNKVSDKLPLDLARKLMAEVSETALVMTAQGLVLINPIEKRALSAVYKLVEEDENEVEIEIIPLDGTASYNAILTLNGDTVEFEPQLKKAKDIALTKTATEKLSSKDKNTIKKYLSAADLEFLGAEATTLVGAVWG
ncbi:MAG: tetratricopeptide repeat protein [Aureispira sp.]|nr:tetratricopeptide repeat protein [Aureispira sp.]